MPIWSRGGSWSSPPPRSPTSAGGWSVRRWGSRGGQVRIIKPYIGGGFGNKQDVLYEPLCAYLTTVVGGRADEDGHLQGGDIRVYPRAARDPVPHHLLCESGRHVRGAEVRELLGPGRLRVPRTQHCCERGWDVSRSSIRARILRRIHIQCLQTRRLPGP